MDASNGHNDNYPECRVSLDNEDFDFTTVSVTERQYYNFLDEVLSYDFVSEMSHSLALNEVSIVVNQSHSGPISNDMFPDGVVIRHVTKWNRDNSSDEGLCIRLSTTRYLGSETGNDERFPGEYSPEAMAALRVELELFPEVTTVGFSSMGAERGETLVEATFEELNSTLLFEGVLTFLGYIPHCVWIDGNDIEQGQFRFSGSRVWSQDAYEAFQRDKLRAYLNTQLDATPPVELPCGHEAAPTLVMVQNPYEQSMDRFSTVLVGGTECHEVPVADASKFVLEVVERPDAQPPDDSRDGFATTTIRRGHTCGLCDVFYPFVDSEAQGESPSDVESVCERFVDLNGERYRFESAPIAALPIGHRDAWCS